MTAPMVEDARIEDVLKQWNENVDTLFVLVRDHHVDLSSSERACLTTELLFYRLACSARCSPRSSSIRHVAYLSRTFPGRPSIVSVNPSKSQHIQVLRG